MDRTPNPTQKHGITESSSGAGIHDRCGLLRAGHCPPSTKSFGPGHPDPDQALSRPIDLLKYGDTVLAEIQGSRGRGTVFYLARVTCVMFFEIPQDDDPVLKKIIQENTLSSGLGVTLTKHHHIRKHGRVSQDSRVKWHLTHQPKNPVWREAVDLGRDTSSSRRTYIKPVKRVVNLVLHPPGNVVILTPNLDLSLPRLPYETRENRSWLSSNRQRHTSLHV